MSAKVYVAGIPTSMSAEDIKNELGSQTAGVVEVALTGDGGEGNQGIAFVSYETAQDAQAAAAAQVVLGASKLTMILDDGKGGKRKYDAAAAAGPAAKRQKKEETSRVLLVSHFPVDTTKDALEKLFRVHGEVQRVDVHAAQGKSSFALVYMKHQYCAERAKREIHGNLWRGATLKVDYTFEDVAENPTETPRVTIALDPDAAGNDRLPLTGLLEWVAWALANDWDKPVIVDASGNVIIPNARSGDDDEDEEEAEAEEADA